MRTYKTVALKFFFISSIGNWGGRLKTMDPNNSNRPNSRNKGYQKKKQFVKFLLHQIKF